MQNVLDRFISAYEFNANQGDMSSVIAQFADTFIAAGPSGSKAIRGSDFQPALALRKLAFNKAGLTTCKLVSSRQTVLGERFAVLDTRW